MSEHARIDNRHESNDAHSGECDAVRSHAKRETISSVSHEGEEKNLLASSDATLNVRRNSSRSNIINAVGAVDEDEIMRIKKESLRLVSETRKQAERRD